MFLLSLFFFQSSVIVEQSAERFQTGKEEREEEEARVQKTGPPRPLSSPFLTTLAPRRRRCLPRPAETRTCEGAVAEKERERRKAAERANRTGEEKRFQMHSSSSSRFFSVLVALHLLLLVRTSFHALLVLAFVSAMACLAQAHAAMAMKLGSSSCCSKSSSATRRASGLSTSSSRSTTSFPSSSISTPMPPSLPLRSFALATLRFSSTHRRSPTISATATDAEEVKR